MNLKIHLFIPSLFNNMTMYIVFYTVKFVNISLSKIYVWSQYLVLITIQFDNEFLSSNLT